MSHRRPLTCLLLALAALAIASPALAAKPNVVVILADDMGYGDVKAYNADAKFETPNIDRLAAEGMMFTDAHAPATVCVPSRYGLLTGRYPFRADVKWNLPGSTVAADEATIGGVLQGEGYRTVAVGKWHLGFECDHPTKAGERMPGGPVDRGFDHFFGMWASLDIPPYYYVEDDRCVMPPTDKCEDSFSDGWTKIQGAFYRGGGVAPNFKHVDVLPTFTEKAVGAIDQHAADAPEQPLFLYFALSAPHTPWLPTAEFQGKSEADMYGDFVLQVDSVVGQVLAAIDRNKMTDDTIVVFSSDNGPVWYDEDEQRLGHYAAGGFRGMKGDLWEGGHRVPFIVRWPGHVEPKTVSDRTITFTDVLPTVAAAVDAKLPAGAAPDGVNILPTLLGEQVDDTDRVHVLTGLNDVLSVRQGPWKLIPQLGSCGFTKPRREEPVAGGPTVQLYNLADDPAETTNLALEKPEIVERLEKALEAKRAK